MSGLPGSVAGTLWAAVTTGASDPLGQEVVPSLGQVGWVQANRGRPSAQGA